MTRRLVGIGVATLFAAVLVILYIVLFLTAAPPAISAVMRNGTANLTIQSVPSYGHAPDPDWVSYLVRDPSGRWQHSTIWKLPANTTVNVTVYQYDTATGLRNPFLAQVRGTLGGTATLNGKPFSVVNGDDASHTFTVPDLGLSVPLSGIPDSAKNPCSTAPCTTEDHTTIRFSFKTPGPGTYRWQCFVPCAAAFIFGNGGPMQTLGWMSGELVVT
ncbi:MAG: hypothetical protein M3018_03075 [Actinomycetota bacterium]|nr:hypothetical protein [Actinomycetota bacterium]